MAGAGERQTVVQVLIGSRPTAAVDLWTYSRIRLYWAAESDLLAMTRGKTSFTPGTPLPDHWFHILLALADDSRHGLGIIQEVTAQTDGHIQVWPGMLYLALKRMTDEGLLAETEPPAGFVTGGGRPRFYRITPLGRRACKAEADRHARLVNAARAKRILRKDP